MTMWQGSLKWISHHAWLFLGAAAVAFTLGLILAAFAFPLADQIEALKQWIGGHGIFTPLIFTLVYIITTLLLFPGWMLTVVAGAVFGPVRGTLIVSLAATTGSASAFVVARYLARDLVVTSLRRYPRIAAVHRAIGRGGWKVVILLRLSPAVPYNMQNYLYGVTSIGFWPCILATWVAMMPATFLYCYLGYVGLSGLELIGQQDQGSAAGPWALRAVGLGATIAAIVYIAQLARRTVREASLIGPDDGRELEQDTPWPALSDRTRAALALASLAIATAVLLAGLYVYLR